MFHIICGISNIRNTTEIASSNSDGDIWSGESAVLERFMDISISPEIKIFFISLLSPDRNMPIGNTSLDFCSDLGI